MRHTNLLCVFLSLIQTIGLNNFVCQVFFLNIELKLKILSHYLITSQESDTKELILFNKSICFDFYELNWIVQNRKGYLFKIPPILRKSIWNLICNINKF